MESYKGPSHLPTPSPPNIDISKLKQNLLQNGVVPTPKIIHTLRKKELQKFNRSIAKKASKEPITLTVAQKQALDEDSHFQTIKSEYKSFNKKINNEKMVGKPWERLEKVKLQELASENKVYSGDKLKSEHISKLSDIIENDRDKFRWLLSDDVEIDQGWFENESSYVERRRGRSKSEAEAIRVFVGRVTEAGLNLKDYKFSRLMRQSGLQFTEGQMLKLVEELGERGGWNHALYVVHYIYRTKERRNLKSRFVYTKLLSILGNSRRPREALKLFKFTQGDALIYPDMAAYHSVAVTLGQAGMLKGLFNIIESMKTKPYKVKNKRYKNFDPSLHPDVVVYNAVLNACVPSRQWKGVFWVFEQLRKIGLRPNGPTYGLAMEVMLQSGKYDLVHGLFAKMKKSGVALQAITYKVLVKTFWKEGKVNEAILAVREMEKRGIIGRAAVYYELACCLCYHGMWEEAFLEIEKLKKLHHTRPLEVTFTGMILSAMDGGHIDGCISIYEHSRKQCKPDIGIINAMLKVYGHNDMFFEAKNLFECAKREDPAPKLCKGDISSSLSPDAYTYSSMLEASACSLQWEYFEYVYKEMALAGYHLDQSKHAYLLVEASKAGKLHLLEHALDAILEDGQIPHPSFFFEMLCQAISLRDYERAITVITTTAHAPFQVREKQWIDLFKDNGDRISSSSLRELLDILRNQDLGTEATILSLRRALESLCKSRDVRGLSSDEPIANTAYQNPSETVQINEGDSNVKGSVNLSDDDRVKDANWDLVSNLSHSGDGDEASTGSMCEHSDEDLAFDDCFDDLELDLGMSSDEDCDHHETKVPSAHEILETWEDTRKRDGNFFPLQSS